MSKLNRTMEGNSTSLELPNDTFVMAGSQVFSAGIFVAVFVLPSILLAFIYGRIYMEAHKNLVRIR